MISFRTHLLTLVSVFLALAIGVVLGGGPLSEVGRSGDQEPTSATSDAGARAEAGEAFAAGAAAPLYGGRLAERQVAVLTLPGADPEVVTALGEQVALAGGTISVQQAVSESLLNPTEKSLVDTLGSQLVEQLPAGSVAAEATTYDRMGQLLGLTLASTDVAGSQTNAQTQAVLDGLVGAELLPDAPARERRAPLVLVVLGDEVDGEGGDTVLGGLLRGLAAAAVGVVVAGESADADSQLARLREGDDLAALTSVDGVDRAPGQVAAGLALIRSLTTRGGAFGASGADGALPLG
ncbi:copper transporter [Nocardioides campestrisoli]|uniref:copper transporter n=1 Tax=Nocardioides campestrisoli TaxID=2736757 RepID=UPI0015E670BE|nr:copper transporter [Nocardioides campestrisoli]